MRSFAIALCLLSFASPAVAQDSGGFYGKLYGGLSDLRTDTLTFGGIASDVGFDAGTTFGGAFGYDYRGSPWRAELAFDYRSGDADGLAAGIGTAGDFASTTVMLNGYYFFATTSAFKPYIGAGVGCVTEIDFDIDAGPGAGEYSDRGLWGAQIMLGAEYDLSSRFSLFGEARYFTAGSVDLTGTIGTTLSADYDTLDLIVGLTVSF